VGFIYPPNLFGGQLKNKPWHRQDFPYRLSAAEGAAEGRYEIGKCLAGIAVLGIMLGYEKIVSTSAEYVQKLHEVTEVICKGKIESFV